MLDNQNSPCLRFEWVFNKRKSKCPICTDKSHNWSRNSAQWSFGIAKLCSCIELIQLHSPFSDFETHQNPEIPQSVIGKVPSELLRSHAQPKWHGRGGDVAVDVTTGKRHFLCSIPHTKPSQHPRIRALESACVAHGETGYIYDHKKCSSNAITQTSNINHLW